VDALDPKNDAYMRRPDGDMELARTDFSSFHVADCLRTSVSMPGPQKHPPLSLCLPVLGHRGARLCTAYACPSPCLPLAHTSSLCSATYVCVSLSLSLPLWHRDTPRPRASCMRLTLASYVWRACVGVDCGGVLKPSVVMFGENVAPEVVAATMALVDSADGVVAAGTSLAVFSIFRFVRRAHERGTPLAIVNVGPTRADDLVPLRVHALTGPIFSRLAAALAPAHAAAAPAATAAATAASASAA
jgi:hypothetical protein